MAGGANGVSLLEAQQNFARFGTSKAAFGRRAQPPAVQYTREKEWRPLNEQLDNIENHATVTGWSDIGEGLYYWRDNGT
jgi:Cysteine-rich CPCC